MSKGIWVKLLMLLSLVYTSLGEIINLNGTGGSYSITMLTQAAFAYQFVQNVSFDYHGDGSGVGLCNMMGFWSTGNTASVMPSLAYRTQDAAACAKLIPAYSNRVPIADVGVSESATALPYSIFPDLQMLPAFPGAVVPIYNIPELSSLPPLVLSRSSIALIFCGQIAYWNDSRILADNTGSVQAALSTISSRITFVVRKDSSGTTNMFSNALTSFSSTFASEVGASNTPPWCNSLTDEVQTLSFSSCSSSEVVSLSVMDPTYTLRQMVVGCNASASSLKATFLSNGFSSITVSKTVSGAAVTFLIGYSDTALIKKNWFLPRLNSASTGVTIKLKSFQEGGYLNAHYSAVPTTLLTQSIFISKSVSAFKFNLTVQTTSGLVNVPVMAADSSSSYLSAAVNSALRSVLPAGVVSNVTQYSRTQFTELRVFFTSSSGKSTSILSGAGADVATGASTGPDSIVVLTLLDYKNYPVFAKNGYYTCYKRSLKYQPLVYYIGTVNAGVIASVGSIPYSIGYSAQFSALEGPTSGVRQGSLINLAGNVVTASFSSITYACSELGGNLDSRFLASLWDGKSAQVWPMSGFAYFIIRLKSHQGDCARRKAAMKFLYDFYTSPTVALIAQAFSFGIMPDTIRSLILKHLIANAQCSNGEYALAEYQTVAVPIISYSDFAPNVQTFINAYNSVNGTLSFSITVMPVSTAIWATYVAAPTVYPGVFTLFVSAKEREASYEQSKMIYSSGFANVAIGILFHLNALDSANIPLQVTSDILAGIYSGSIRFWNDTQIQNANPATKQLLPYKRIFVVSRSGANDDTSALFIRFLALKSAEFRSTFNLPLDPDRASVDFTSRIDPSYLRQVSSNSLVDSAVLFQEGSIGYYLYVSASNSKLATYCHTADCASPVKIGNFGDQCSNDLSTVVSGPTYSSFDLMISQKPDCYPIGGTVDYSVLTTPSTNQSIFPRVGFSSWLFSTSTTISPSPVFAISSTPAAVRSATFSTVCGISTSNTIETELGYTYCGYSVCVDKQYNQEVSECSQESITREVSYILPEGSTCRSNNPSHPPPSTVSIDCTYIPNQSGIAIFAYVLCVLGVGFCSTVLFLTWYNRKEKLIKRSQPLFLYIYLFGCILMNFTILVFVGDNSNVLCAARPIMLNISSTIMFAPLVMKLRRVHKLINNKKLKKMVISNSTVIIQCLGLLAIDVIILILWGTVDPYEPIIVSKTYTNALVDVDDTVCNSGFSRTPFEAVILAYKALLLAYGTFLAVSTWNAPPSLAESKPYAIAIYNIFIIGGVAYFLGGFVSSSSISAGISLEVVGMFLCPNISVLVIMVPKLLAAKGYLSAKGMLSVPSESSNPSRTTQSGRPSANNSRSIRSSANSQSVAHPDIEDEGMLADDDDDIDGTRPEPFSIIKSWRVVPLFNQEDNPHAAQPLEVQEVL